MLPGLGVVGLSMPALTGPSIDSVGVPSECLLLKNMFDPNSEVSRAIMFSGPFSKCHINSRFIVIAG